MADLSKLLNKRMKGDERSSKMAALAKQSSDGQLTSFSGLFGFSELSKTEKERIALILEEYAIDFPEGRKNSYESDLNALIVLASEVKAITNQAALLHGERIKKAQAILKCYREGAFTAWLISTYGNRQTPYNLLQYYEFCQAMPEKLKAIIEKMPRQAIYTLASRQGSFIEKQKIVESYRGESKEELLLFIRKAFPLPLKDKRKANQGRLAIQELEKLLNFLKREAFSFSNSQKKIAKEILAEMGTFLKN